VYIHNFDVLLFYNYYDIEEIIRTKFSAYNGQHDNNININFLLFYILQRSQMDEIEDVVRNEGNSCTGSKIIRIKKRICTFIT